MAMFIFIVLMGLWILGIPVAYKVISEWEVTKFEKIWFSCLWPLLIILRIAREIVDRW